MPHVIPALQGQCTRDVHDVVLLLVRHVLLDVDELGEGLDHVKPGFDVLVADDLVDDLDEMEVEAGVDDGEEEDHVVEGSDEDESGDDDLHEDHADGDHVLGLGVDEPVLARLLVLGEEEVLANGPEALEAEGVEDLDGAGVLDLLLLLEGDHVLEAELEPRLVAQGLVRVVLVPPLLVLQLLVLDHREVPQRDVQVVLLDDAVHLLVERLLAFFRLLHWVRHQLVNVPLSELPQPHYQEVVHPHQLEPRKVELVLLLIHFFILLFLLRLSFFFHLHQETLLVADEKRKKRNEDYRVVRPVLVNLLPPLELPHMHAIPEPDEHRDHAQAQQ